MKPHIQDTLNEIEGDITTLTQLRDNLTALYGGANAPAPAARRGPRTGARRAPRSPHSPAAVPAGKGAPDTNGAEKEGRWSGEGITILAHIRKMPEPISGTTLAVAAGIDRVKAGNFISRFAAKGWLKKTGYGEYSRTASLPEQL